MIELLNKIEKSLKNKSFSSSFETFNRQRIKNDISTYSFYKIIKIFNNSNAKNINDDGWIYSSGTIGNSIKKSDEHKNKKSDEIQNSQKSQVEKRDNDKKKIIKTKSKSYNDIIFYIVLILIPVSFFLFNKLNQNNFFTFSDTIKKYITPEYKKINKHGYVSAPIDANVRSSPNLNNKNNIITVLSRGDKVFLIDKHNKTSWYKIKYNDNGSEGYISNKVISLNIPSGINEINKVGYAKDNIFIQKSINDKSNLFSVKKEDSIFVEFENIERGFFRVTAINDKSKKGFIKSNQVSFTQPSNIISNNQNKSKQTFSDNKEVDNRKSKEVGTINENESKTEIETESNEPQYHIDRFGNKFTGNFDSNGKRTGKGVLIDKNGNRYEGTFKNNILIDGTVDITYSNGDRYKGSFSNNQRQGLGKLTTRNGSTYQGEFKNNILIKGNVNLLYNNGDRYIGDFSNNQRQGKGKLTLKNGSVYEGVFKDDVLINGHVKNLLYSNGDKYNGSFSSNRREGDGTLITKDGAVYKGIFRNNLLVKGRVENLKYSDGSIYSGEFSNNIREGQGILKLSNGNIYEGEFKSNNLWDGILRRVAANGMRVHIQYKNGRAIN